MLRSARRARLEAWPPSRSPCFETAAEPVIGPRFARTRWRPPQHEVGKSLLRGIVVGRRGLAAAFGHRDQRRPQHPIADQIAGLHHLDDGARRYAGVLDLVHRLMTVGVELL